MNAITDVIEMLSTSNTTLGDSLLKTKIIAQRIGEMELKRWVDFELAGYPLDQELPPYRIIRVTPRGNVSNMVYRYQDHMLPITHIEKKYRKNLETADFRQAISVIEHLAANDGHLQFPLAPEMAAYLSKGLSNDFHVESAWLQPSAGAALQVITEVRSRLTDFLLNLEEKLPENMSLKDIKRDAKDLQINDLFKQAVFGNNTTIIVGNGNTQNVSTSVTTNNFPSLAAELSRIGVEAEDIASLKAALEEDSHHSTELQVDIGPKARSWIGRMVSKAGSSSWNISMGAAGNILASAISTYLGITP